MFDSAYHPSLGRQQKLQLFTLSDIASRTGAGIKKGRFRPFLNAD
jgi:hypothetical protein